MKTRIIVSLSLFFIFAVAADLAWSFSTSFNTFGVQKSKCCCSVENHQSESSTCSCCSNTDNQEKDSESKGSCEKKSCHCSLGQHFAFLFSYDFPELTAFLSFEKLNFSFYQTAPQFVFLATWQPPKLG